MPDSRLCHECRSTDISRAPDDVLICDLCTADNALADSVATRLLGWYRTGQTGTHGQDIWQGVDTGPWEAREFMSGGWPSLMLSIIEVMGKHGYQLAVGRGYVTFGHPTGISYENANRFPQAVADAALQVVPTKLGDSTPTTEGLEDAALAPLAGPSLRAVAKTLRDIEGFLTTAAAYDLPEAWRGDTKQFATDARNALAVATGQTPKG